MPASPTGRLRIGELADLSGTTTRAIRHYHALGLLAEPSRDSSGYRRYGPADVVRLVRIRRLRALGMPLEQIRDHIDGPADVRTDLPAALIALVADVTRQITTLERMRTRILEIADAGTDGPADEWAAELRRYGHLGAEAQLPAIERDAAALLDAIHPNGMTGVMAAAEPMLRDPAVAAAIGDVLKRFRLLPNDAGHAEVESLARDVAALVPPPPDDRPPLLDDAQVESLLGSRLSAAQQRCMRRVRELLTGPAAR